ncbi:MAG: 2-iminoacetate synthase ThiH [Bdellovibrionales bacterium]|nr:2-iminoacetate synthase ThiH [Bdellovibrionales bacterium]
MRVVRSQHFSDRNMSFEAIFNHYSWEHVGEQIASCSEADIQRVLRRGRASSLGEFAALLSPKASDCLEALASRSQEITRRRFGNVMQLYAPLYVSNECQNICTYCGYSFNNQIPRLTLSDDQLIAEAQAVRALGFQHVLLVSGEANKTVGLDYFLNALELVKPYFAQVSMEVQPLSTEEYRRLVEAGLYAVLVYQETYNQQLYKQVHPKGKKSNFFFRLDTPDRLGQAGVHKIGLGVLLGLSDWRTDAYFVAAHLMYLRKKYWKTRFSVSFPRLRPAEGVQDMQVATTERDLLQLICAFRFFDENLELSLSTRESAHFRDHAHSLGVTSMSAGSKTEPGGYAVNSKALKQFEIDDNRSPAEVQQMLQRFVYEVVWKDWEPVLQGIVGA